MTWKRSESFWPKITRALLQNVEGVEGVGEAGVGTEVLGLIGELKPDIVLTDIALPGLNGLEVASRSMRAYLQTRILILSMHANEEYVMRALRIGVRGYLLKDACAAELELAIRAVSRQDAEPQRQDGGNPPHPDDEATGHP